MPAALIALFYLVLCAPGLALTWWLLTPRVVEPSLRWAIPAPRLPEQYNEVRINSRTDWRGFT